MSDIQDKINKILSDPEALKQLQGLGAQLGLSGDSPVSQPSSPPPAPARSPNWKRTVWQESRELRGW